MFKSIFMHFKQLQYLYLCTHCHRR